MHGQSHLDRRGVVRRFIAAIQAAGFSRFFAYASILLLQAKTSWGLWQWKDLTPGDTSFYFVNAYDWYQNGKGVITWSPLYGIFMGAFFQLSSDAYWIVTAHRLALTLITSALVLAVMRRLLPPLVAWLMAAWWVVLPINFDTLYEVHLFALIPVLTACLVVGAGTRRWRRGAALAVLLLATILVRNELLVATVAFAALVFAWEVRGGPRRAPQGRIADGLLLSYGAPLALVACISALLFIRARDRDVVGAMLSRKHTLNICQVYAFGYQQRYTDFRKSPWLECQELMHRVFGVPEPTLVQAVLRKPSAVLEHLAWNLRLFPAGIQVLMFNQTSAAHNPDYAPVRRSWVAVPLTIVWLGIIAVGALKVWGRGRDWWRSSVQPAAWAWLVLLSAVFGALIVGMIQRPRPSYLFSLGILLRAFTGALMLPLFRRLQEIRQPTAWFPLAVVVVILLTPSYYGWAHGSGSRPLLEAYRRLARFEELMKQPATVFLARNFATELCNYVAKGRCTGLMYPRLVDEFRLGDSWLAVLRRHRVNLLFADESLLRSQQGQALVAEVRKSGWRTVAFENWAGGSWCLLQANGDSR